ncbi:meiosis inhibitor protein 1 [Amia ocellicauda]|uniref:meiosis inhibitor protein 1 n=1 Tax=Amia ocellicauda TaxID=2972642 RepID=UPI0034649E0D
MMADAELLYDKTHYRHDQRWAVRLGSDRLGSARLGPVLCVACVIEILEDSEVSVRERERERERTGQLPHKTAVLRKRHALCCLRRVTEHFPSVTAQLLLQDQRVCLHFTGTLLGMLHTVEDTATLEQAIQVLLQLVLELKNDEFLQYLLKENERQLCSQASLRSCLPSFILLGRLLDTVPTVAEMLSEMLVAHHGSLLEHVCEDKWSLLERVCAGLLFPDEALKGAVVYVLCRLWSCPPAVARLPPPLTHRLCRLLLSTLSHGHSAQLLLNCLGEGGGELGFLRQLLRCSEAVSVLMSPELCAESDHDCSTELTLPGCSLPLALKKLLLSGDESLQMASSQCMVAILQHSPSQYGTQLIQADIPEFLFERVCCASEMLLCSVYSCLLLLTQETLFFTKCHAVYGLESLVRSVKEALRRSNQEVQRQGLQLLTEVLHRQPVGIQLFSSASGFREVAEAVQLGLSIPCLQVATQAACAASALLRLNHLSSPVQYRALQGVLEAAMDRCKDLPLVTAGAQRRAVSEAEPSSQASRGGRFLLQALVTLHTACRLAAQCASEPGLQDNAFTAPDRPGEESLASFSLGLLHICDSVCIPTVTKLCERGLSPAVLQVFYAILSCQYTLTPSMMPQFSTKLASSCFYRLTLELKSAFCAGESVLVDTVWNPLLNATCSEFLQRMSLCLLDTLDTCVCVCVCVSADLADVCSVLRAGVPGLSARLSEWPALLGEEPTPGQGGLRATQYSLITLLCLSHQHHDRLVPGPALFQAVVSLLCSVQEQGDRPPTGVLRAALYLLAVSQDRSPHLDRAPVHRVCQALSVSPIVSLFSPHPAVLHFLFLYPELSDRFGLPFLECWLARLPEPATRTGPPKAEPDPTETKPPRQPEPQQQQQQHGPRVTALLSVLDSSPTAVLTVLGVLCTGEAQLAHNALLVLRAYLQGHDRCNPVTSDLLRPQLLQILQRFAIEKETQSLGALSALPLVLQLLCVVQSSGSAEREMDDTDFRLLYHVANLAVRLKPSHSEALQPALNYLYCSLALSPEPCANRAVSMLLCNTALMLLLQAVLELPPAARPCPLAPLSSHPPAPLCSPSTQLCCAWLLLASLLKLQRRHSAQVHRSISLSLDKPLHLLSFRKQQTDNLLLASCLRLLHTLLDQDLRSPLLSPPPSPSAQRVLGRTEAALLPLGSHRGRRLLTALHGLLLQRQELLLGAAVSCLASLLGFLHRKSPPTALHTVSQPWTRFLLYTLQSPGDDSLLHPALLTLLTLLVRYGSRTVVWEPDLAQVLQAAERRDVRELGEGTARALTVLLVQLQSSGAHQPPSVKERQAAQSLQERLQSRPLPETQHWSLLHGTEPRDPRGLR